MVMMMIMMMVPSQQMEADASRAIFLNLKSDTFEVNYFFFKKILE